MEREEFRKKCSEESVDDASKLLSMILEDEEISEKVLRKMAHRLEEKGFWDSARNVRIAIYCLKVGRRADAILSLISAFRDLYDELRVCYALLKEAKKNEGRKCRKNGV